MPVINIQSIAVIFTILVVSFIIFLFLPTSLINVKIDKNPEEKLVEKLSENLKE